MGQTIFERFVPVLNPIFHLFNQLTFLESENICLRAPEPEDLELLYEWENDSSLWIAGNTRAPYSKFQLRNIFLRPEMIFIPMVHSA